MYMYKRAACDNLLRFLYPCLANYRPAVGVETTAPLSDVVVNYVLLKTNLAQGHCIVILPPVLTFFSIQPKKEIPFLSSDDKRMTTPAIVIGCLSMNNVRN